MSFITKQINYLYLFININNIENIFLMFVLIKSNLKSSFVNSHGHHKNTLVNVATFIESNQKIA